MKTYPTYSGLLFGAAITLIALSLLSGGPYYFQPMPSDAVPPKIELRQALLDAVDRFSENSELAVVGSASVPSLAGTDDPKQAIAELFDQPEGKMFLAGFTEVINVIRTQWQSDLQFTEQRIYDRINQALAQSPANHTNLLGWLGLVVAVIAVVPSYLQMRKPVSRSPNAEGQSESGGSQIRSEPTDNVEKQM